MSLWPGCAEWARFIHFNTPWRASQVRHCKPMPPPRIFSYPLDSCIRMRVLLKELPIKFMASIYRRYLHVQRCDAFIMTDKEVRAQLTAEADEELISSSNLKPFQLLNKSASVFTKLVLFVY